MEEEKREERAEESPDAAPVRRGRKTPKEIFSHPSKLRLANIVVCAAVFVLLWVMFALVSAGVVPDPYDRRFSYVVTSLLMLAPWLIELIFGIRLSDFVLTFGVAYALVAGVVCSSFALYKIVPNFDKVVHFAFGYVGSLVGLLIVCKLANIRELRPVFVAVVCFAVSMACGAVWEIMEFVTDLLFAQTAQGMPVETVTGEFVTPRDDTMLDIVCNFGGALVYLIHYVIHRATGRSLLIGAMVEDFSKR